MITKLSRIDSSSSSLKYSVRTEHNRWRKNMISAALEFRLDRAITRDQPDDTVHFAHGTDCDVGCACN